MAGSSIMVSCYWKVSCCGKAVFFFGTLLCLVFAVNGNENSLTLSLFTDPPGPSFPAATWIRFACKVEGLVEQSSLMYKWKGICSKTGAVQLVIEDAFLDKEGHAVIWADSTPVGCLDYWECSVEDGEGNNVITEVQIENISGLGLSINIPLVSIGNNTAIILDRGQDSPFGILCHSALTNSRSGEWISPDGSEVVVMEGIGDASYYWNLTVSEDSPEGVYRCTTSDEEQVISIGVYRNGYELRSFMADMEYSEDLPGQRVFLSCSTRGLPATAAVWDNNDIMISLNGSEGDFSYTTTSSPVDPSVSLYSNTLTIHDRTRNDISGTCACNVYSDWLAADQSAAGRERVTGHFVFVDIGESVSLYCTLAENVTEIQWYKGNTYLSGGEVLDLHVTDTLHKAMYSCQGLQPDGNDLYLHTKLIVKVPDEVFSVAVSVTEDEQETLNLLCCADVLVEGLSNSPSLSWYDPSGQIVGHSSELQVTGPTVNNEQTCLTLLIRNGNVGKYHCKVELDSPAFDSPLVKTVTYEYEKSNDKMQIVIAACIAVGLALMTVIIVATLVGVMLHQRQRRATTKTQDADDDNKIAIQNCKISDHHTQNTVSHTQSEEKK